MINIHRTPLNCITLLRIVETQVDPGPLNRTEMLEKFLYVLFSNLKNTPSYSTVPDLKDSLYIIGYYTEKMLRSGLFTIDKADFLRETNVYCNAKLVDIETDTLFNALVEASVLVKRGGSYVFRFTYWLYFFAAYRMHQDEAFFQFTMRGKKYSQYPEIIEFYSGIDRRRSDLLEILLEELSTHNRAFLERNGITDDNSFLTTLTWEPDKEALERALEAVIEDVQESALPASIKDAKADEGFDYGAPYYQGVRKFLEKSSLILCTRVMRAAARALRNSDHADVELRRRLMAEIMQTWSIVMKVTAMLLPALATEGRARFEGFGFRLHKSFLEMEGTERMSWMIASLPYNVSNVFRNDVYSAKMIPLLKDFMDGSVADEKKYLLASRLINERGGNWFKVCEAHINALPWNSFFLYAILEEAILVYRYGFVGERDRADLRYLIGLAVGRHRTRKGRVSKKEINLVASKILDDDEGNQS